MTISIRIENIIARQRAIEARSSGLDRETKDLILQRQTLGELLSFVDGEFIETIKNYSEPTRQAFMDLLDSLNDPIGKQLAVSVRGEASDLDKSITSHTDELTKTYQAKLKQLQAQLEIQERRQQLFAQIRSSVDYKQLLSREEILKQRRQNLETIGQELLAQVEQHSKIRESLEQLRSDSSPDAAKLLDMLVPLEEQIAKECARLRDFSGKLGNKIDKGGDIISSLHARVENHARQLLGH
jgi:hypothetical protein